MADGYDRSWRLELSIVRDGLPLYHRYPSLSFRFDELILQWFLRFESASRTTTRFVSSAFQMLPFNLNTKPQLNSLSAPATLISPRLDPSPVSAPTLPSIEPSPANSSPSFTQPSAEPSTSSKAKNSLR